MTPVIQIENLRKSFRKTMAVDGLNLTIPAGSVTAFLGPNGAGKTTTIKCLLNLHTPDSGTITVLGQDSRKLGAEAFQKIAYVSENQEMPGWMTVSEFLDYCRPMYPNWDKAFAQKLAKQFDLPPNTKLKSLSRGMKMKAALLSSLAYRPRLVVLDEPFSGLDPLVRDEFIRGLLELTEEEGWSVFVSSHDIEEVERLADRVAIIHQGRLQLEESSTDLQARFRNIEVALSADRDLPQNLPATWLNTEMSGRIVRFTDSNYDAERNAQTITTVFPTAAQPHTKPMTLREIFVALARTYRLNGFATSR